MTSAPDEGSPPALRVALLMWGDIVEDFLDPIGWTLDDFLQRMSGGWLFGYIDALERQGIACTLILFTRDARAPLATVHAPTGARVRLLPTPRAYRAMRRVLRSPYHWLDGQSPVDVRIPAFARPLYAKVRDDMPFHATPADTLLRVVAEERCDAILCQEYEEPRFDVAVDVGARLGVPVVGIFQGARARRSRREEATRPQAMARAAAFVIGSSREAARVRARYGVEDARIVQAFNPIDRATWFPERDARMRESLGIAADATVVAWHGRVALAQKGVDVLLRAFDRARTRVQGLHLLLVGAGPDMAHLDAHLAARHPRDDVTWVREYIADRAAMRRFLSAADVWAMPSRFEGFPVAPLEAMACGLPVVATDVEGIEDIAPRGEGDGVWRVPIDDEDAIADALVALGSDATRRQRMRDAAMRRIDEAFTPEVVGRQLAGGVRRIVLAGITLPSG